MSATSSSNLDLQEQVARINRALAESDKFSVEQRKLAAEARKFDRDRFLAPLTASIALLAALASLASAYILHMH